MKTTTAALALVASIFAIPLGARNVPNTASKPKVVSLSTQRKTISNPVKRDRLRRRDAIKAELDNEV